jgi:hypothetical protein
MTYDTDRSRILTYQACPRKRWHEYECEGGRGIAPIKKSLALSFGSAFHEAAQTLLTPNYGDKRVDDAVLMANSYLDEQFAATAVDFEEPQTVYNMAEQRAIAEGLVRAWAAYNLERFLDTFEVLEVEQEGRAELAQNLVLMFRPDALVREKATGDLFIVSWKTSSTWMKKIVDQCQVEMQPISEAWGVEQRPYDNEGGAVNIEGVLYLFCVKGQCRLDDYDNIRKQNTPLAYAWFKPGPTPEEDEWCWAYEYVTEEMNDKTGKFKKTKLGKGWRKVPVWESYPGGIKQWIDDLAAQRIQPRHINALESIFPEMLPVSRKPSEIESWRRQVVSQESRVRLQAQAVEQSRLLGPERFKEVLDREFPQHTSNCYSYNSRCSCWDVCWTEAVAADPLNSGLYQIRTPNHPSEKNEED